MSNTRKSAQAKRQRASRIEELDRQTREAQRSRQKYAEAAFFYRKALEDMTLAAEGLAEDFRRRGLVDAADELKEYLAALDKRWNPAAATASDATTPGGDA